MTFPNCTFLEMLVHDTPPSHSPDFDDESKDWKVLQTRVNIVLCWELGSRLLIMAKNTSAVT